MAVNINVPSQVKTYANLAAFPATGALKTIYIAEDTNKTYRWTGSVYTEISASAAMTWGAIGGTLSNQTDLQSALNAKENTISAGTTSQYFRGDKTFQTLDKAAVGLGNVDNTSDANKPISTATQTALNAKQNTLSLTTTGDNGASTLVGSTLNVPNYTLSGLGGVPTSRTLTINGVTQDLSANRTFTISTGITIGSTAIASGTVGRILFEGAGNVVQESSSLTFNDTTKAFLLSGNQNNTTLFTISNTTAGTLSNPALQLISDNSAGQAQVFKYSSTRTPYKSIEASDFGHYNATAGDISFLNDVVNGKIKFATNQSNTAQMTLASTGNLLLNTTTDAGFRLDVNGTARVQGLVTLNNNILLNAASTTNSIVHSSTFSSSTFSVLEQLNGQNIGGFIINSGTGESRFGSFRNGGGYYTTFYVNNAELIRLSTSNNVLINTTTDAGYRLDVNGTARVQGNTSVSLNQNAITSLTLSNTTNNANASVRFYLQGDSTASQVGKLSSSYASGAILKTGDYFFYNQSVGNITFWNNLSTGTINFTTGTGTSPQMTLKASGVLNLSSVPTSPAGLSAGDVWNNLGVLMIV